MATCAQTNIDGHCPLFSPKPVLPNKKPGWFGRLFRGDE
jgi:hypothetical protein